MIAEVDIERLTDENKRLMILYLEELIGISSKIQQQPSAPLAIESTNL